MHERRFPRISRRTLFGVVTAGSLAALTGCGTTDSEVLAPTSTGSAPGTARPGATASDPGARASLTVDFTYEADASAEGGRRGGGGGMVRNPYIAVWVEDADEELVATIALWHLQREEDRWLSDLREWYDASGGVEAVSSATRVPGSYSVGWDCTDTAGSPVAPGSYTLYIESAREHGPYQLIGTDLVLGSGAREWTLEPDGELTAASASYSG